MPRFPNISYCAALALCLPASTAIADVTAADVWSDWKNTMTSAGYTLNAVEASDGNSVIVTDLSISMDLSDDTGQGAFSMSMPSMQFTEDAAGGVVIELPTTSTIDVRMMPESGEDVAVTLTATLTDPSMTAAGDPGNVTYDYGTATTEIVMSDLTVDGVTMGEDIASASMVMEDTSYVLTTRTDDIQVMKQTAVIGAINYQFSFDDPEGDDSLDLNGTMRDVAFDGGVDLPTGIDPQDVNAMLKAGFNFGGMFATQGGGYDATFKSIDGSGTINSTSASAGFVVALSPEGLDYAVSQTGVDVNVLVTEFPVPLSFAADELALSIAMPVQKSNDEQGFGIGLVLGGITISDTIWGMFDPAGQLPRSPANLVLDLTGTAKVLFDFLDPAQAEVLAETGAVPGTLNTMDLNELELEVAGARLTGDGAFNFDNDDLVTFDGMPRPEGAIDLTLTGGNTLLDTLVNMGFVPEDQAMGARMMMGLFAVPVEGEDTLNSRIEVNPEGHVLANGQRLR